MQFKSLDESVVCENGGETRFRDAFLVLTLLLNSVSVSNSDHLRFTGFPNYLDKVVTDFVAVDAPEQF